jgi:hypothetical protein
LKKIILDIGSHKLEEINLFFIKDSSIILFYLNWWFRYFNFVIKKLFSFSQKENNFNFSFSKWPSSFNLHEHKKLILHLFKSENITKSFKLISVEPNFDVCFKNVQKFKKKIDLIYFPFVLSNLTKNTNIFFSNFYTNSNSLSSSIYKKKNNKHIKRILSLNITSFIEILKREKLINQDFNILLRINCEGEELEIIKELIKNKIRIDSILGSLSDVKKIHGDSLYNEMLETLTKNNIAYVFFKASDPSTWLKGISTLKKYLKNA